MVSPILKIKCWHKTGAQSFQMCQMFLVCWTGHFLVGTFKDRNVYIDPNWGNERKKVSKSIQLKLYKWTWGNIYQNWEAWGITVEEIIISKKHCLINDSTPQNYEWNIQIVPQSWWFLEMFLIIQDTQDTSFWKLWL